MHVLCLESDDVGGSRRLEDEMLDAIVRYLHSMNVPFRLESYPSPEPLPGVVHRMSEETLLVDTSLWLVGGRPAVACVPAGMIVDVPALASELDALVIPAGPGDLPAPFDRTTEFVPPLGGAFGIATLLDAAVRTAPKIAFRAFARDDYIELTYDDYALLEHPRVASFGVAGELEQTSADATT